MTNTVQYSFKRYEKKYFLTPLQKMLLLDGMRSYIKEDDYGKYTVCNIYYDTPDWRLIRESVEKPVYKEKLRVRSYGVPECQGKVFAELKKKYKGVVYKRRITCGANEANDILTEKKSLACFGQIGNEIEWFRNFYCPEPKMFIGYDRIAFSGTEDSELRITFDTNMRWRTYDTDLLLGDAGEPILPEQDKILMEIKIPGVCPLWLSRLLSETGVFPCSFSKYGFCYTEYILKSQQKQTKKEAHICA